MTNSKAKRQGYKAMVDDLKRECSALRTQLAEARRSMEAQSQIINDNKSFKPQAVPTVDSAMVRENDRLKKQLESARSRTTRANKAQARAEREARNWRSIAISTAKALDRALNLHEGETP